MRSFFIFLNRLFINKFFIILFCILLLSSSIISFILKINLSSLLGSQDLNPFLLDFGIKTRSGGVVNDLATHWQYITYLKENISNLFKLEMGVDTNLINFPLHNIIISQLYFLADNLKYYLLFYFCFSLILPYIFYLCLIERFKKTDKYLLIIFASIIYIFPAFQYSAIWGSSHISSLFFFLIGIFYHLKFKASEYKKITYILFSIIFFSLAAYSRQYYVFFFLFIFVELFFRINLKTFISISLFTFTLGFPGLIFLIKNPLLFLGFKSEITNFGSSILISSSICFFYMLPIFIQYILNNNFKKIIEYKNLLLSFTLFILCVFFFTYEGNIGGGIIHKLSFSILNQKVLFFILSFLGIYFLFFFTKKNVESYLLSFLLLCTFSTGYYIFQKYFEPMFFMIFLLYFQKIKIITSIENKSYFLVLYFITYYLISNYIYFFGV